MMPRTNTVSVGTMGQHRAALLGQAGPASVYAPAGGHPQFPGKVDMTEAHTRMAVVNNMVGVHDLGSKAEHQEGDEWYPKVHDATMKGVRQHKLDSPLHGAGMVAAVSPNMDFENNNIHAFGELAKLSTNKEHLDVLRRSMTNKVRGDDGQMRAKRTPEMKALLTTHYPNISRAPDGNIHKALRIMSGEHPDTVLDPRTAPKTNSFAHNIADPSRSDNPHTGHALATVDGRQYDIGTNVMRPWGEDRGISSSAGARGGTSRYEHFANATADAAKVVSAEGPKQVNPASMQARTWVIAKKREIMMAGAKKKKATGEPYQGPNRVEQPYI